MTLLQALCQVNGQQGGTIHQFFPGANLNDVFAMQKSYAEYTKCGIEFPSRRSFDKLAAQYGLTINW